MRYTIHDIARELGVSARTVGRVVGGLGGVSAATRKRIEQFIEQVGYQPHSGAQSLRNAQTNCIGVVLSAPPDELPLSTDLFNFLFNELYQTFGVRGEFISFDLNPPTANGLRDYCRGVWQRRFGATVIAGAFKPEDTSLARIHRFGEPYVALGRLESFPEGCYGTVDYEDAACLSTRFLLERGHTRVGMLQGLPGYFPGVERLRGYRRAYDELGIAPEMSLVRPVDFSPASIVEALRQLALEEKVSAIVDCSGAENAKSLREGARRAGRMIGRDLELVVWTYTSGATVLYEAAAHVWCPVREAASEAIRLLGQWYYGQRKDPIQLLYRPVLFEKPSSDEIPAPKPLFAVRESK